MAKGSQAGGKRTIWKENEVTLGKVGATYAMPAFANCSTRDLSNREEGGGEASSRQSWDSEPASLERLHKTAMLPVHFL